MRAVLLIFPALLALTACAAPDLPDLGGDAAAPAPALVPTEGLLAMATPGRVTPGAADALAARAAALAARGAALARQPLDGPEVPPG